MTIKAENWLGEFVSTIGTGDAILGGAIDGFAGFSNVGDDVDVYYTIMDGLGERSVLPSAVHGGILSCIALQTCVLRLKILKLIQRSMMELRRLWITCKKPLWV